MVQFAHGIVGELSFLIASESDGRPMYGDEEIDDDLYLMGDPANWKEHYPWDAGYVSYVYTIDQYHNLHDKLVAYLAQSGLSEWDRKRTEYQLRAIERDKQNMKMGTDNEWVKRNRQGP